MRNSIRFAALAVALSASGAQAATTATGNASAEILNTLTVTEMAQLNFGQVAVNGAGTVVIAANGSITCGALLVCTGAPGAASFDVTQGTAGVAYAATVTTSSVSLTDGGSNSMTLDTFTVGYPGGTTLNASGASTFAVGGTLHVAATQAAAVYLGSYTVSVEYQ